MPTVTRRRPPRRRRAAFSVQPSLVTHRPHPDVARCPGIPMVNPEDVLSGVRARREPEMNVYDDPLAHRRPRPLPPRVLNAENGAEIDQCLAAPVRPLVDPHHTAGHGHRLAQPSAGNLAGTIGSTPCQTRHAYSSRRHRPPKNSASIFFHIPPIVLPVGLPSPPDTLPIGRVPRTDVGPFGSQSASRTRLASGGPGRCRLHRLRPCPTSTNRLMLGARRARDDPGRT
jgi:hypothetical protein